MRNQLLNADVEGEEQPPTPGKPSPQNRPPGGHSLRLNQTLSSLGQPTWSAGRRSGRSSVLVIEMSAMHGDGR